MGATRRGTYAAAEAATAATGSEARPSQASPSAAAAGGDGASPMGTAPMVNEGAPMVDDAGDEDEESSDEEDDVVMDIAKKLECGGRRKNHARTQVTLPAGTQPNVVHINTFCSNEKNKLWGEIGFTEVAALPHTAANRFKITDDLVKAYAKLAARANDLGLSRPAEDGGSRVMLMPLVTETLQRQGASILAPPHGSDGNPVFTLSNNVPALLAQGYTQLAEASAMYFPGADDPGPNPDGPPEAAPVNIPRMREHLPSLGGGGDVVDKLVQMWEVGYSVGQQSFSPLRMWTKAARKRAWDDQHLQPETTRGKQQMRDYMTTRLGALANMYWAVKHIDKDDLPTSGNDLEKAGRTLLKSVSGAAADLAAQRANQAVSQGGEATARRTV